MVAVAGAWVPSYWSDEAATVRAASLSPAELIAFVQHKDAVHADYNLLIGLWTHLAGSSELALRIPSAVAVAVTATTLVCIFRRFDRAGAGVVAGVVFAVLPRTTYMGAEARSYALATALCAVMALFTVRTMQRRRATDAAVLALVAASATAIFVYSALVAAAMITFAAALVALQSGLDRRNSTVRSASVTTGAALVGVGAAAPLVVLVVGQKSQIAWLGSQPVVNLWTVLAEPWAESSGAVAILGVALLLVATWRWRAILAGAGGPLVVLLVSWTFVPGALLLALNAVDGPLYTSRYLSFITPAVAGLLALVVRFALTRRLGMAALVLLLVIAAPTYVAQRTVTAKGGADLRPIADYIGEHARPADGFLFEKARTVALDPRQALAAYPDRFAGLRDVALARAFPKTGTFADTTRPIDPAGLLSAPDRIWLIAPSTVACVATDDAVALLRADYDVVGGFGLGRDRVCEFRRP
jgi:mannosyltransferase